MNFNTFTLPFLWLLADCWKIVILFLGWILLSLPKQASGQEYFNRRYDVNYQGWSYSQDILERPGGYVVSYVCSGVTYYSPRRMGFFFIDSTGNVNGTPVILQDSVISFQTGWPGSLIELATGIHYACIGTKMQWVPDGRYDRGWLLFLNGSFDTLETKMFTDIAPHDTSIMFRNFRRLDNGGFVVVGLRNPVTGDGWFRTGMFRTDSAGNELWRKSYGSGNKDIQPLDVALTSDQGFVIGSLSNGIGATTHDATPFLLKTDSIGNQQWSLNLGNPDCRETDISVDLSLDGNIQVGTYYSDTCYGGNGYDAKINFLKVRPNKSIVWDKKYGNLKQDLYFSKIKVLPCGDIIGTGWYMYSEVYVGRFISWIIRTDSAGNEKWYREYAGLNGNDSHNYLFNVIPVNDGGFAACGFVLPVPPDTGTQDSWVIKVDSLGCESPSYCWVGQEEIMVKTFTPAKPFVVYPNPADESVTVEFHIDPEGTILELMNMSGMILRRIRLQNNDDRFEMEVGSIPPGIYLLRVYNTNTLYTTVKLLKR